MKNSTAQHSTAQHSTALLYFIFLMISLVSYSQSSNSSTYYYYNGGKVPLTIDKNSLNIEANASFANSDLTNFNLKNFEAKTITGTSQKFASITFNQTLTDFEYLQKVNGIKNQPNINTVEPSFVDGNGNKMGMSNYLYVKLKSTSDMALLQSIATTKNLQIVKEVQYMPLWYVLKCTKTTIENTLEIANYIYETGRFDSSSPDFLADNTDYETNTTAAAITTPLPNDLCVNDTFYYQQWGLENTYTAGIAPLTTFNTDINACAAWTISKGENINIAVIDTGIDLSNADLLPNLHPLSYDAETGTSPSQVYGPHGVVVAGVIGTVQNNNYQISGVAPKSKLMSVSNTLLVSNPLATLILATGINWAVDNKADVLNCSWRARYNLDIVNAAIQNATTNGRGGLGAVVVFSSGNSPDNAHFQITAPANNPNLDILTVGASTLTGMRADFSCHGNALDVVAPGMNVLTTYSSNTLVFAEGTSLGAPHVSGIAALILSVNPCLTAKQVRDIIEKTAQKVGGYHYTSSIDRPNGTWNIQMGYGLVDAHAAVLLAQQLYSETLDLAIKDTPTDFGVEPDTTSSILWNSPDIWVRNVADGDVDQYHENPLYFPGVPNYIYVRIINKSCVPSLGNEKLKVYGFIPNATGTTQSEYRSSIIAQTNQVENLIGTVNIPVLTPGQETILHLPWYVPYGVTTCPDTSNWNTNIVAKVITPNDPMTVAENSNVYLNIKNNNNIAGKSVVVVNTLPTGDGSGSGTDFLLGATIVIGNPSNETKNFRLELIKEDLEIGKAVYDEAEITLKMDDILYNAWQRGGKLGENFIETADDKKKIVEENHLLVDNINFEANEVGKLSVNFNFLTKEMTNKTNYLYHIIQRDKNTNEIVGGATFEINKKPRPVFIADAGGDKVIDKNEPITISANQINEAAIYNWYDTDGNLIFVGKDLSISTAVAQKYKLEVIATADGFKDYTEVEVNLNPSVLSVIAPNPVSENVTIGYKVNQENTAYLMILGSYGTSNASNNYILNVDSNETTINLSNYSNGFYTVALVCNGQIVDAKTIIKN